MDEREFRALYQAAFSQVRSAGAAAPAGRPVRRRPVGLLTAAAVAALAAVVTLSAYAGYLFGLGDLLLAPVESAPAQGESPSPPGEMDWVERSGVGVLSLQGYADSPESLAMAEWLAFLESYDADGAILEEIGNGPTDLPERYGYYFVYTQEMGDKLDEIVDRYGLRLHTDAVFDYTREGLMEAVGGAFVKEDHEVYCAYMYEDGTFHYDGEYSVYAPYGGPDGEPLTYQLTRCVRGSFTDILYQVYDPASYDQWTYVTASGQTVLLALGPDVSLVVADLGESMVTVNAFCGSNSLTAWLWVDRAFLEAFADSIDFSILS